MLPFPLFLLILLFSLAGLTYLLRSWDQILALVASALTALLAFFFWRLGPAVGSIGLPWVGLVVDPAAPLERFGFTLQLQPAMLPMLTAVYLLATVAFVLAARVSQGHSFVPVALVLLAGYSEVVMMTEAPLPPLLLYPLFLIGLSCLSAFVLQAGRLQHPAGPLRTILPPVLAFPLFLLAAWYLQQIPLNPQDLSARAAAAQLLSIGLLLIMAPVPLHSALPTTMQSAPPVVGAFVVLVYQYTAVYLFFRIGELYSFVPELSNLAILFGFAGVVTAVWGGFAAAGTNHAGRLWGYAALHDWGLLIMVMGISDPRALPLAIFLLNLRAISMLTASAGLAVIEQHAGGLEPRRLQGAGTRLPWNSAALLLGGLGLAGFPLTAGFTGHWAAIQVVAENDWRPAVLVLLASGGAIFGFIRLARILFGPLENRLMVRERPMSALVAVVALLLSVSLAMAPQLLDGPITRALLAFGV